MRFRPLLWLSLLLASCDKRPENQGAEKHGTITEPPPAVTKSHRAELNQSKPTEASGANRDALDEAKKISSPKERDKAVAAIVWENLELNPKLALEALQELAPGCGERVRLIQHFAMRLAERDIEEAIKWADTLENPEEISLAYGRISLVLSDSDPARAANLISESGMAGREFDVAVVQVIQRWAASSPPAAAAWVVLFDPSTARSAGINTVVSLWAKSDTQAALTWIGTLQNEGVREEARQAMAEAILQQPPKTQNEWLQLSDPAIRSDFEKLKARSGKEAAQ
ncbi:MAG: hypothetical protein ABI162_09200 [Luteolibacter sp.]